MTEDIKHGKTEINFLWRYLHDKFNITSTERFYHFGNINGTPVNTYDAAKLYLIISAAYTGSTGATGAGRPYAKVYDEGNIQNGTFHNHFAVWNQTSSSVNYGQMLAELKYFYCSRLSFNSNDGFRIIGYKFTITP